MYIDRVPNRQSPPCLLLRESYRENGRVKKRTLANLTNWPSEIVEGLRLLLQGDGFVTRPGVDFEITRTIPHGHVAAVLGIMRKLGFVGLLSRDQTRKRDLVVAMVAARIIDPRSKLATARGLRQTTMSSSLGEELGVDGADEDDLYEALDWLLSQQERIENKLAERHLEDGTLLLYDVTSTYFEGKACALAKFGHSRDKKKGKRQIVVGLLCNAKGCPIAIEVFEGNTGDPSTLESQVLKVKQRFKLHRVIFVGDRGLITSARIRETLNGIPGVDWITALRSEQIQKLVSQSKLQLSLFDEQDLAEIKAPDLYPAQRLVACRNPLMAERRSKKREELLKQTEKLLNEIVKATKRQRQPLQGATEIALRVGKNINRYKVGKHFITYITENSFSYVRNEKNIQQEAALDGIYVIRSSTPAEELPGPELVESYKKLSSVEQAFRSLKTVDLKVRPIFHRLSDRVRAHVFLCMLAYYVEWHMRELLAPMLFDDDEIGSARAQRKSPVQPIRPSAAAKKKAVTKKTDDGFPVHSFQSLLSDLATICKCTARFLAIGDQLDSHFVTYTKPTPLQSKTFHLLGLSTP